VDALGHAVVDERRRHPPHPRSGQTPNVGCDISVALSFGV